MKPRNFFSKTAFGVLIVLFLAVIASQAYAELRIDSVYPTMGIKGQDLPITIKGSGFDANTRVSMTIDAGNRKTILGTVNISNPLGVVVSDSIAYVAASSQDFMGLQVVDVGNPLNPKIISSVEMQDASIYLMQYLILWFI